MKVLVVDDEQLAVRKLEKMLTDFGVFQEIVTFQNSMDARNFVKENPIDVAFVDIEMPGMNGMKLALEIQEICPNCNIVFVTAYEEYAIQAFEVQALDYVVKPITLKRLKNTVSRIVQDPPAPPKATVISGGMLHLFGELMYTNPDEHVLLEKWRTKKTKALFCYLLHYRNKIISRDMLIELYWPDIELKKAVVNLHSTVYQLRKMLKSYSISLSIQRIGEGYQLELGTILTDVDVFKEMEQSLAPIHENNVSTYEKLVALYKGNYLQDIDYLWVEGERTHLRTSWMQHMNTLIQYYVQCKQYEQATQLCCRMQEIVSDEDISYKWLRDIYRLTGNTVEAAKQDQFLQALYNS